MSAESTTQEPRWRRMPEERPRQIIDAALAEFGERGLAAARLEDIAKRAGVSKGTIYLYFPNKEELFREMVRQTIVARLEESERALPDGTATEQVHAFVARFWSFIRSTDYVRIFRLVVGELPKFPELARFYSEEVFARYTRTVGGIISRGIDSGEFRPVDPQVSARILSAMMSSHALWCSKREQFTHVCTRSDDEILAEIESFFFHALRPLPAAGGEPSSAIPS